MTKQNQEKLNNDLILASKIGDLNKSRLFSSKRMIRTPILNQVTSVIWIISHVKK